MSNMSILLFMAIIPVMLILLFVYYKDRNKEPMILLLELFVLGIISCGLTLLSFDLLGRILPFMKLKSESFIDVLLYTFLGVALIEETSKWIMLYIFGYRSKHFDEKYDGLIYAVFVSLGFAFIENIMYILTKVDITTAVVRAFSAVPSHACDAVFMGYYMSIAKAYSIKENKKEVRKNLFLSLIVPILLHGIYDFCLMMNNSIFLAVFFIFVVFMYFISIKRLNELSLSKEKILEVRHRFCKYCGQSINHAKICPNCGKPQI